MTLLETILKFTVKWLYFLNYVFLVTSTNSMCFFLDVGKFFSRYYNFTRSINFFLNDNVFGFKKYHTGDRYSLFTMILTYYPLECVMKKNKAFNIIYYVSGSQTLENPLVMNNGRPHTGHKQ